MICFKCGKIGYQETQCINKSQDLSHMDANSDNENFVQPKEQNNIPTSPPIVGDFGTWMMVKKHPPQRRAPKLDKPPIVNPHGPPEKILQRKPPPPSSTLDWWEVEDSKFWRIKFWKVLKIRIIIKEILSLTRWITTFPSRMP